MDARYRFGQRPGRRRRTRVLIVTFITLLIVGGLAAIIIYDVRKNKSQPVEGESRTVVQALDEISNKFVVNEPTYMLDLPSDWKEIDRQNTRLEHSVTFEATEDKKTNRFLKIYVDLIPTDYPVNKLLPLSLDKAGNLNIGDISPGCHTFTQGSSQVASEAQHLSYAPAKYETVDFICNRSQINDNEIGTGSADGVNTIILSGPSGPHKYFFLYTDRNIQPDYSIFYNALKSFKAK